MHVNYWIFSISFLIWISSRLKIDYFLGTSDIKLSDQINFSNKTIHRCSQHNNNSLQYNTISAPRKVINSSSAQVQLVFVTLLLYPLSNLYYYLFIFYLPWHLANLQWNMVSFVDYLCDCSCRNLHKTW